MVKKMDREAVEWVVERLSLEWPEEKKAQKVNKYLMAVWGTTDSEEIRELKMKDDSRNTKDFDT